MPLKPDHARPGRKPMQTTPVIKAQPKRRQQDIVDLRPVHRRRRQKRIRLRPPQRPRQVQNPPLSR